MANSSNSPHKEPLSAPPRQPSEALGTSPAFVAFQERISAVARVDRPVLILGERGVGKELAATRLHYLSQRWQEPLVTLNCAALAPTLIESELFGYEAGAFTGAQHRRIGRFEAAHGGTLFLDEIGHIPMEAQTKILRVVEYGVFERVGGIRNVSVDARIVAATNMDLAALAEQGRFLPDLLDRLAFEVLYVPPLRERREDIGLLANAFAARMAHQLGRTEVVEFADAALAALESYDWPGNVRELKNVVERAIFRADAALVTEIEFDPFRRQPPAQAAAPGDVASRPAAPGVDLAQPLAGALSDLELRYLRAALERARHNQRKAAALLGLSYDQFRGLFRKHRALLSA